MTTSASETNKTWSMVLFDRARELTEFCLRHGGKAIDGYTIPILFQYAFFHLAARTAFVVKDAQGKIAAALFCWGMPEKEIRARGSMPFHWQPSDDRAGALFVAEVIKRPDCGDRLLHKVFRQATARWPDWEQKKIFTFRNGFLVELDAEAIARMIGLKKEKEKHHGR